MTQFTARQGRVIFGVLCFLGLALLSVPVAAEKNDAYYQDLQKRLIADGFDAAAIRELYARPEVKFETKGISVYFVHRESKVHYERYTDQLHIEKARVYLEQHRAAFTAAENVYGVDPEVITAIILVETQLGTLLGSRSVLNTLSTMAALSDPKVRNLLWRKIKNTPDLTRAVFDKKAAQKSKWAYRELMAFLRHAQLQGFDPAEIKGSFAGAMGIAQFMPSNILAYGQDGDGDGRIDLFNDADAIISIANYLRHYGWKPGLKRDQAYKVVYHYNHSKYYVDAILKIADLLEG